MKMVALADTTDGWSSITILSFTFCWFIASLMTQ